MSRKNFCLRVTPFGTVELKSEAGHPSVSGALTPLIILVCSVSVVVIINCFSPGYFSPLVLLGMQILVLVILLGPMLVSYRKRKNIKCVLTNTFTDPLSPAGIILPQFRKDLERVITERVEGRLVELAVQVVQHQEVDCLKEPYQKIQFRELFDAAKELEIIKPDQTYDVYFHRKLEKITSASNKFV